MLPAGLKGPAFLATNNFSVLKLYNNSDVYAIFVGHVADMIASQCAGEFAGAWQPVERLPRDRIQRFQEVLVAQGHDVGKVDGLAGFKTRAAIGVTEKRLGLPLTCYPSQRLVEAVMKEASAARRKRCKTLRVLRRLGFAPLQLLNSAHANRRRFKSLVLVPALLALAAAGAAARRLTPRRPFGLGREILAGGQALPASPGRPTTAPSRA